jgi:FkbM family methyltransferase
MSEVTLYACRHGVLCHFTNDNTIGRSLQLYGEWAEQEVYTLGCLLEPGDWVIDAGANVGTHTLSFAQFVGKQGKVIAFEPQLRVHALLCANMVQNDALQVVCFSGAVGKELIIIEAPVLPDAPDMNYGDVSLLAKRNFGQRAGLKFPLVQISIDDLNLPRCNLIKADVEGMELDLFEGAKDTISKHRPVIYFEQNSLQNWDELKRLFRAYKYRLYWHPTNPHNKNNFNRYAENVFGGNLEVNVIGCPEEKPIAYRHEWGPMPDVNDLPYPNKLAPMDHGWVLPEGAYNNFAK